MNFNDSLDNAVYNNCYFLNCTFSRIFISHVFFNNCTFLESEFSNVKTSRTHFENSTLQDIKLIDTDLTGRHFTNCTIFNTTIIRLTAPCDRDFEFNIYLDALWRSNLGALVPSIIALSIIGEFVHRFGKSRMAAICFIFAALLCASFGFLSHDEHIIWTGGVAQGFMLAGLAALTMLAVESYSTPLRATALGLFICGGHIGALIGGSLYSVLPVYSVKFASAISTITMIIPVVSSIILKDPCLLI